MRSACTTTASGRCETPDCLTRRCRRSPVAGTWRGLDGVRGFVEEWLEASDEFRVEPDEFIHGDDAVVVAVRYWGRGKGSGVEITDRWFYAYLLRDGKVVSWRPWSERAEALKAVGLEE